MSVQFSWNMTIYLFFSILSSSKKSVFFSNLVQNCFKNVRVCRCFETVTNQVYYAPKHFFLENFEFQRFKNNDDKKKCEWIVSFFFQSFTKLGKNKDFEKSALCLNANFATTWDAILWVISPNELFGTY